MSWSWLYDGMTHTSLNTWLTLLACWCPQAATCDSLRAEWRNACGSGKDLLQPAPAPASLLPAPLFSTLRGLASLNSGVKRHPLPYKYRSHFSPVAKKGLVLRYKSSFTYTVHSRNQITLGCFLGGICYLFDCPHIFWWEIWSYVHSDLHKIIIAAMY